MKTNGLRASHRNRWLFVENGVLTLDEMIMFEFYVDKMNFSPKSEDVGTFELDFEEIKRILGKGKSTVHLLNKGLLDKGFITKIYPYKFRIPHWERYILGTKDGGGKALEYQGDETDKPVEYLIQKLDINFQIPGKSSPLSTTGCVTSTRLINKLSREVNILGSKRDVEQEEKKEEDNGGEEEKDDKELYQSDQKIIDPRTKNQPGKFPRWVLIRQEVRTEEVYKKLELEMDMPAQDMKWIDENLYDFIKIDNEEKEDWYVEIYFDGDRGRYEKYLDSNQTSVTIGLKTG